MSKHIFLYIGLLNYGHAMKRHQTLLELIWRSRELQFKLPDLTHQHMQDKLNFMIVNCWRYPVFPFFNFILFWWFCCPITHLLVSFVTISYNSSSTTISTPTFICLASVPRWLESVPKVRCAMYQIIFGLILFMFFKFQSHLQCFVT